MGLNEIDVAGLKSGVGQRLADDCHLGGSVRRGQAVAAAVLVGGCAADHGQDAVAIGAGVGEALQHDDATTFTADKTIRGCVEGLAPTVG